MAAEPIHGWSTKPTGINTPEHIHTHTNPNTSVCTLILYEHISKIHECLDSEQKFLTNSKKVFMSWGDNVQFLIMKNQNRKSIFKF